MQPETLWRSKLCKNCGIEFGAKRSRTFYCSTKCRSKGQMVARHFRETALLEIQKNENHDPPTDAAECQSHLAV